MVTTFALVAGILVAHFIQPGANVNTNLIKGGDISDYTKGASAFSWLRFLQDNKTIQVLIISIILGILLSKFKYKKKLIQPMQFASKYIFKALHIVMLFAPIGAFGGMAFTIGKYGLATLIPLGKLMLTVYITMAVDILS